MTLEIFCPHGSNPLQNLRIANPRCAKVEFDRTVRNNILIMDGDVSQSKISLPKDGDRPLSSLQLPYPLICFQVFCPSSGQCSFELNVSHNAMTRMKLTSATFTSRADVVDAKGIPHIKLPLAVPRNMWTQIVFHVPGVVSHLFNLPAVKSIDSIAVSGSVRIRRIFACQDEATALDKPQGMLLFTVPAFGPPVWRGANHVNQQSSAQATPTKTQPTSSETDPPNRLLQLNQNILNLESIPHRASSSPAAGKSPVAQQQHGTPPPEGVRMRFARGEDGRVTFTANDPEQPPTPPETAMSATEAWVNRMRAEAEIRRRLEEHETSYQRLVCEAAVVQKTPSRGFNSLPKGLATPPSPTIPGEFDFATGEACEGWGDDATPDSIVVKPVIRTTAPAVSNKMTKLPAIPSRTSKLPVASPTTASAQTPPPRLSASVAVLKKVVDRQITDDHPADCAKLPISKREREVGYGIGDLEIIRTRDTEEDDDDDDDGDTTSSESSDDV